MYSKQNLLTAGHANENFCHLNSECIQEIKANHTESAAHYQFNLFFEWAVTFSQITIIFL